MPIGIIIAVGVWIVILIWVAVYEFLGFWRRRRLRFEVEPRVYGFPVIGAGCDGSQMSTYLVIGVEAATSKDIRTLVDAETAANAKVKAELRGIIVTDIVPQ
jgi:hypothetical protein